MKPFMDEDFLLRTPTARHLYHDVAAGMPILDYHCHIDPREIAEDRKFENITQSGWEAIIISGGRCVPTGSGRIISPETPRTGRNFRNGRRRWRRLSGTRCSTGAIWSCSGFSATTAY